MEPTPVNPRKAGLVTVALVGVDVAVAVAASRTVERTAAVLAISLISLLLLLLAARMRNPRSRSVAMGVGLGALTGASDVLWWKDGAANAIASACLLAVVFGGLYWRSARRAVAKAAP